MRQHGFELVLWADDATLPLLLRKDRGQLEIDARLDEENDLMSLTRSSEAWCWVLLIQGGSSLKVNYNHEGSKDACDPESEERCVEV